MLSALLHGNEMDERSQIMSLAQGEGLLAACQQSLWNDFEVMKSLWSWGQCLDQILPPISCCKASGQHFSHVTITNNKELGLYTLAITALCLQKL